jgi:hypothetical protein
VLGKTLPGAPYNYSFALDFDGWDAVLEFFDSWEHVLELSKKTRIEWHGDKERIHCIFISKNRPVSNRKIKIKTRRLRSDVKNSYYLLQVLHPDGNPWTTLPYGTNEIAILDEKDLLRLEVKIDALSQGYMSNENKQRYITWLEDPNTTVGEGCRHDAVKILGCSY